jgi:hypothetical protein
MFEGFWARVFYPDLAKHAGFRVRYFALNIEDPGLSRASEWEEAQFGDKSLWARDRYNVFFIPTLCTTPITMP